MASLRAIKKYHLPLNGNSSSVAATAADVATNDAPRKQQQHQWVDVNAGRVFMRSKEELLWGHHKSCMKCVHLKMVKGSWNPESQPWGWGEGTVNKVTSHEQASLRSSAQYHQGGCSVARKTHVSNHGWVHYHNIILLLFVDLVCMGIWLCNNYFHRPFNCEFTRTILHWRNKMAHNII